MPFEARFRESNRSIHTAEDTLERSANNAAHAVKFARLAAAYAIELGKGELGKPPAAAVAVAADEPASSHGWWRYLAIGLAAVFAARWLSRRR